jgi:hypothetical protein
LGSTLQASFIIEQVAQQLFRRYKVTVFDLQEININSHQNLCPESDSSQKSFSDSRRVDAIGIIWNPGQEILALRTSPIWTANKEFTKHLVLLYIAKTFVSSSQATFITERVPKELPFPIRKVKVIMSDLQGAKIGKAIQAADLDYNKSSIN